ADAALLRGRAEDLRGGLFTLLVTGPFNAGKSTLVNALVGEDAMMTGPNPTTALTSRLSQGDELSIKVHPRHEPPYTISQEEYINRFTIEALERTDKAYYEDIDYISITYPFPLLAEGVGIVDTPGLGEQRARTAIVLDH